MLKWATTALFVFSAIAVRAAEINCKSIVQHIAKSESGFGLTIGAAVPANGKYVKTEVFVKRITPNPSEWTLCKPNRHGCDVGVLTDAYGNNSYSFYPNLLPPGVTDHDKIPYYMADIKPFGYGGRNMAINQTFKARVEISYSIQASRCVSRVDFYAPKTAHNEMSVLIPKSDRLYSVRTYARNTDNLASPWQVCDDSAAQIAGRCRTNDAIIGGLRFEKRPISDDDDQRLGYEFTCHNDGHQARGCRIELEYAPSAPLNK